MAFKPEEISRLEQLADEMARLIEDVDTTSSEASVVYGKIGRTCARALANVSGSGKDANFTSRREFHGGFAFYLLFAAARKSAAMIKK